MFKSCWLNHFKLHFSLNCEELSDSHLVFVAVSLVSFFCFFYDLGKFVSKLLRIHSCIWMIKHVTNLFLHNIKVVYFQYRGRSSLILLDSCHFSRIWDKFFDLTFNFVTFSQIKLRLLDWLFSRIDKVIMIVSGSLASCLGSSTHGLQSLPFLICSHCLLSFFFFCSHQFLWCNLMIITHSVSWFLQIHKWVCFQSRNLSPLILDKIIGLIFDFVSFSQIKLRLVDWVFRCYSKLILVSRRLAIDLCTLSYHIFLSLLILQCSLCLLSKLLLSIFLGVFFTFNLDLSLYKCWICCAA